MVWGTVGRSEGHRVKLNGVRCGIQRGSRDG